MSSIAEQVEALIQPGDNILVLSPSFTGDEPQACMALLTPAPLTEVNALSVLFTESPSDRLDAWQRYVGSFPARSCILNVDADARSSTGSGDIPENNDHTTERLASPRDLTKLGVKITDCLDRWTETAPEQQITVCFQSISTLLQYVTLDQVFKFLDVLTERCRAADAISHYHMDPLAHDNQTIERLTGLFDVVLEYVNGEWSCRRNDSM
ncbi:DUF7504 family protein [Halosimplex amylolyticum]|uniref:DUF7504 family protein n=1 Tax=Halosimplex amylolyticum TaxID=3396616 RepID=UPI003F54B9C1